MRQLRSLVQYQQSLHFGSVTGLRRPSPCTAASTTRQQASRCILFKVMGTTQTQDCSHPKPLPCSRTMWTCIQDVYQKAESSGALVKIQSSPSDLVDKEFGLKFVLQISEAFKDKPKLNQPKSEGPPLDAFDSLDRELTVLDSLSPRHMLRLNKFNVVPYHSLVITRQFESQQAPLTIADWEATHQVLQAFPDGAMVYFNSGEEAGASQPRKHLQILPIALGGQSTAPLPLGRIADEAFQETGRNPLQAVYLDKLPFQSFAALLPKQASASDLHQACSNLLAARPETSKNAAYNVLAAEHFLLLVPRSKECCGPISCNALVFAGTLLVRSQVELDYILAHGPMHIMQSVTFPWG